MSTRPRRPYTQAIRDVIAEGPATVNEVTAKTWHLFPVGACVQAYRRSIQYQRRYFATTKTGFDISIEEQHRRGAKQIVGMTLVKLARRGIAVKEDDRYRLV